jgi:hypothetical protein
LPVSWFLHGARIIAKVFFANSTIYRRTRLSLIMYIISTDV